MAFTSGHALIIGVGSYGPNPPLSPSGTERRPGDVPITLADAEAVAAILQHPAYCAYPPEQVTLLHGQEATRERMLAALDRLVADLGPDDTLMFFYAGHGAYDTDKHYCLTANDTRLNCDGQIIADSGLREAELLDRIRQIRAQRVLLIFNACHAGELSPDALGSTATPPAASGEPVPEALAKALLGTGAGRVMISACRQNQKSFFRRSDAHTLFGAALVEALEGRGGPSRHGYVSVFDLYEYIYASVRDRAKKRLDELQEPELTISKGVGAMAVAMHRGATATTPPTTGGLGGSLGGAVREVEPAESRELLDAILSGKLRLGDTISVRSVSTGGGAYAGGTMDNRQGSFGNTYTLSNISGTILNLESTLTDVRQQISGVTPGDAPKSELEQLAEQLAAVLRQAPAGSQDVADAVSQALQTVLAHATKATPNRQLLQSQTNTLQQYAQLLHATLPEAPQLAARIAELLSRQAA